MALGLAQELKRQLYPVIGLSTGPTQFTRISPWFGAGGIDDGHYQQEGFGEAS
jgi:hypothetical protein